MISKFIFYVVCICALPWIASNVIELLKDWVDTI